MATVTTCSHLKALKNKLAEKLSKMILMWGIFKEAMP